MMVHINRQILKAVQYIEENIAESDQFDGDSFIMAQCWLMKKNLPTDNGGLLEIRRSRIFNGAIKYDGGWES